MRKYAIILLLSAFFTFSLAGYKLFLVATHPVKYQKEIVIASQKYNLDPSLVAGVIKVESFYNQYAKSNKNACGLMQVKLSTAEYMSDIYNIAQPNDYSLYHVENNIEYGCAYLNYLSKKFSNLDTILAAYNAGETTVRNWLNNPEYSIDGKTLKKIPYKETENYIKKVKINMKFYMRIY
ncbi:MAG: lytic transglycosylase domain-containing protein [Clostridia bacterium]|nr:lytic transglycosylase domain-containing protein [Clostridia bacterium]